MDTIADSDQHIHADRYCDSNVHCDGYPNLYALANGYCYVYTICDEHSNFNSDLHAQPDIDAIGPTVDNRARGRPGPIRTIECLPNCAKPGCRCRL